MNISELKRGREREKTLEKSIYYSDGYFSLPQLYSQSQQIHDIHNLRPINIIEVGLGNGFTSSFLKRAGYEVTTVDINQSLEPDVCCSIEEIPSKINDKTFDLVVCCEVLEHMEFEAFERNIKILKLLGNRLYLTLPVYVSSYGFGISIKLPRIRKNIPLYIDIPRNKLLDKEHFWEVGSNKNTSRKSLINILSNYYTNIKTSRYALNPYHMVFFCNTEKF